MKERPVSSLWFPAAIALGVALVAWFVFDSALVHGIIIGAVGALALLAGTLAFFMRRVRSKMRAAQEGLGPPPLPDTAFDYEIVGRTLEGAELDFSQYQGRVLVLNLWGTWCGPCVAEMPSFVKLMERTEDYAVDYAFVTMEPQEKVRPFVEKRGWELPVVLVEPDVWKKFQLRGVPATFVVGKGGRIAMRHMGGAKWDADEVVQFLQGMAVTPG